MCCGRRTETATTPWSTNCAATRVAARTAKKLLNDTENATLSVAIDLRGMAIAAGGNDDFREGVEAFHGKRRAKFRGS